MPEVPWEALALSFVAGLAASLACGLGVIPLMFKRWDPARHRGMGFAVAGGLMFSASVYNLILPGMDLDGDNIWSLSDVATTIVGLLVGAGFLAAVEHYLHGVDGHAEHGHADNEEPHANGPGRAEPGTVPFATRTPVGRTTAEARARSASTGLPQDGDGPIPAVPFAAWGGKIGLLVFIAMTFHSIPEGVAVGVGFTSDAVHEAQTLAEGPAQKHDGVPDAATSAGTAYVNTHHQDGHVPTNLGITLALAIGLHNIPEGLAVAIPLRSAGVSIWRCFWAAVFTSLPQPLAAIPAVLLAWLVKPMMPGMMAFAAGAMIFLIVLELIPEALETESPTRIGWGFMFGFAGMLLLQVLL